MSTIWKLLQSFFNLHGCLFVCLLFGVITAAASGSPALSASGFGVTHDPSAPGLDSARPARRHLQLWPPVAVQHSRVTRSHGQGGQELSRRGWRPPRGWCRQIRLAFAEMVWFCLMSSVKRGGAQKERRRDCRNLPFPLFTSVSLDWVWFNLSLSLC